MPTDVRPGFSSLLPDDILGAVEAFGYATSGDLLALNSYENRVYRVGLDAGGFRVVKFYRPARWSDDAILEEHRFAQELAALEIPVVPPESHDGETLLTDGEHRFAVFDCVGGRWPTLEAESTLRQLGRLTARIHLAGQHQPFAHRTAISIDSHGDAAREFVLDNGLVPDSLLPAYTSLTDDLLDAVDDTMAAGETCREVRIHNDLHPGNVLEEGDRLHIVDTDDVANGLAVQDLWMFLSGEDSERNLQLSALLEGYEEFRSFDSRELTLIEALRTLRLMHYTAWLGRRWHDPAFKRAFAWFDSVRYWNEHVLALREQLALLQDPPLLVP
ncbi:MAG: serine/threonine protein kinase [Pseudomonadota bacterium]